MNVMIVDDGGGEFFFLCQALEAMGAQIIHSPSLDEDKVLTRKIDVVVHVWSGFTSDIENVQIRNILDTSPAPVVAIFAQPQDVNALRRTFRTELVADMKALDAAYAPRTAEAMVLEVRAKRAPLTQAAARA